MTKVKLLTNKFLPDWQAGVTVEFDDNDVRLSELIQNHEVEVIEKIAPREGRTDVNTIDTTIDQPRDQEIDGKPKKRSYRKRAGEAKEGVNANGEFA